MTTTSAQLQQRKFILLTLILVTIVVLIVDWTMIDIYPGGTQDRWQGVYIYFWWMWVVQPIVLGVLLFLIYYLGTISHEPDVDIKGGFQINRSILVILGVIATYFILLAFAFQDFLFYMIKTGGLPYENRHLDWMFFNYVMPGGFYGRHFIWVVIAGWVIVAILWWFLLFRIPSTRSEKNYKIGGSSSRGGYKK